MADQKHKTSFLRAKGHLMAALATVVVGLGLSMVAPRLTGVASAAPTPAECFSTLRMLPAGNGTGNALELDVTPAGSYVAYTRQLASGGATSVIRVNLSSGTNQRIDVTPSGNAPNGSAWGPSITPDGRYVAFVSDSSDLVANDGNGVADVFVRDLVSSVTTRVSVGPSGSGATMGLQSGGGGDAILPARETDISDDGRYVVFASERSLVSADSDSVADIYRRDRTGGTTSLVSVPPASGTSFIRAYDAAIAGDGSAVVFAGRGTTFEVFRRDMAVATAEWVSPNTGTTHGAIARPAPAINIDGTKLAYVTEAILNELDPAGAKLYVLDVVAGTSTVLGYQVPAGLQDVLTMNDEGTVAGFRASDGWRAYATGGVERIALDAQGQPISGLGSLIDDGESLVHLENRATPDPTGTVIAHRAFVDRASAAQIRFRTVDEDVVATAPGQDIPVRISGYNLAPATGFVFDNPDVTVDVESVANEEALAILSTSPASELGPVALDVVAASGCAVASGVGLEVVDVAPNTPEISSLSVSYLRANQSTTLVVAGSDFLCPCQLDLTGGITQGTLSSTGTSVLSVFIQAPAFSTDAVADLTVTNRYGLSAFIPAAIALHSPVGEFHPLTPSRILDTRTGTGGPRSPIDQTPRTVQVSGAGGVPGSGRASAVVMNVTVTGARVGTYVTVWPADAAQPLTSNINLLAGQTAANQVTVPLSSGGAVKVFVANGTADVIFDVVGYYGTSLADPGGRFVPLLPDRVIDTREEDSPLGPEEVGRIHFDESPYAAMVLNVTVTQPTASGYLTVTPAGDIPLASSINFRPGQTVANLVTVAFGDEIAIDIFNSGGVTHVIVDIVGVYGDGINYVGDSAFRPMTPVRFLDTRAGVGGPAGKVGAGGVRYLGVAGEHDIPPMAAGIAGNATAVNPSLESWLTIWPDGAERPPTSNLNFLAGQTVPNALVMALGDEGGINIYNASGTVDVVVDVSGWFTAIFDDGSESGASASASASGTAKSAVASPSAVDRGSATACVRCEPSKLPGFAGFTTRER